MVASNSLDQCGQILLMPGGAGNGRPMDGPAEIMRSTRLSSLLA
jgi:hypothetical protein